MLGADGALRAPPVRTRRGGRPSPRDSARSDRRRPPDRLDRRERGHRHPDRRGDRPAPRRLQRLPAVQRLMATGGLFSTPRPEPGHLLPALGGGALIPAAPPVFLPLRLPVSGWAPAAGPWGFVPRLALLLAR